MKSNELNKMLIKHLPQLHKKYIDEVSWQEGDDPKYISFGHMNPASHSCLLAQHKTFGKH